MGPGICGSLIHFVVGWPASPGPTQAYSDRLRRSSVARVPPDGRGHGYQTVIPPLGGIPGAFVRTVPEMAGVVATRDPDCVRMTKTLKDDKREKDDEIRVL